MATTNTNNGCSDISSPCHPAPDKCPTCGGLECLCRPRFFAGQLLTEENLNHLNQYIIKKNQLHNHYLHGTGVVCGLEVSSDPCDERRVSIAEGYALSPCGNDIVVCAEDSVDICKLIQDCRNKEPRDCRPYAKPDKNCRGVEETWLLGICYEETASRGITALRSSSAKKSCPDTPPRGAPPQCEPTQVCEGYRYRLFKMPEKNERVITIAPNVKVKGRFFERLMCCIESLGGTPITTKQLHDCQCRALMPECPEPSPHDCVPLAAITVAGDNCKIIKVCNWSEHRKYVLTMPTLKYWLSILSGDVTLAKTLGRFCCNTEKASGEGGTVINFSETDDNDPDVLMNTLVQPLLKSLIAEGGFAKTIVNMLKESTGADAGLAELSEIQEEMKQMKKMLDNQAAEIRKLHARKKGSD